jgi:hypothetical protein
MRRKIGTKADLIEDLLHEIKSAKETNNDKKFVEAIDAIRTAMNCSVSAKKLRDFMIYDFADFFSEDEEE